MSTQTYTATLTVIECARCHMDFGATPAFVKERRGDHKMFYCPLGCSNYYGGKSDLEEAQAAQAAAERRAESMRISRDAARDQADTAERRRRAAKGQLTKTRKRIANGVCPCCNRTFPNVADHMASKHPEYVEPMTGATTA